MKMLKTFRRITFALLLVAASASLARAQVGDAAGLQANRDYFSQAPGEHIDPLTGSLVLQFTDLMLPGNAGRDVRFQRTFNLKGASQATWTLGIAGLVMSVEEPSGWTAGCASPSTPVYCPLPILVGADGSRTATVFLSPPANEGDLEGTRWVTNDKFWKYDRSAHRLYWPDGSILEFDSGGYLTAYQDPFGNRITLSGWGSPTVTVTQALGNGEERVVTVDNWGGGLGFTNSSGSLTYGGRTWTYQSAGSVSDWTWTVTPPVGPSSTVEIHAVPGWMQVTTPNGGTTQYTFEWREFPTGENDGNGFPLYWATRVVTNKTVGGRDIAPASWQYAYQFPPDFPGDRDGLARSSTITAPDGTKTTYVYGILPSDNACASPNYNCSPVGGSGVCCAGYDEYRGRWAMLTSRTVEFPVGTVLSVLETESRAYRSVVFRGASYCNPWACTSATIGLVPELTSRTITRNGRSYTTQFVFSSTNFADYHRPYQINETGDLTRTTTRTFEHHEPPIYPAYIVGLLTGETVQVGSESFTKSRIYNNYGFMTSETLYGLTTTFTPDVCVGITSGSCGNVATMVRSGQGGQKTTTYQYSYGVVKQLTLPNGNKVVRTIDPAGLVTEETSSGPSGQNARMTTFSYDGLFRLVWTQPPGGVLATSTSYDVNGWFVTVSRRASPFAPPVSQTTTSLDGFGRPRCASNSLNVLTCTEYDAEGRKSRESLPVVSCGLGCGPTAWTTFAYDGLGRLTRKTNPDTPATNVQFMFAAVPDALTVAIQDENVHVTEQALQAFADPGDARLARVKDALASPNTWTYTYNALGNLTRVHPPTGSDRTWTYDTSNRLISEFQPESGTVTYTYVAGTTLLATKTDARGTVFTHTYDNNDRLLTITADPTVGANRVTSITYEVGSDNRATMSVTGGSATTFTYETATGRLSQRRDVVNSTTFDQFFAYDTLDQLITLTYPAGRKVGYEYDSEGRITRVCSKNAQGNCTAGADYASGFTYHASGAVSQYTGRYGLVHQFAYDGRYRVQAITACTTAACTAPGNRLSWATRTTGRGTSSRSPIRRTGATPPGTRRSRTTPWIGWRPRPASTAPRAISTMRAGTGWPAGGRPTPTTRTTASRSNPPSPSRTTPTATSSRSRCRA